MNIAIPQEFIGRDVRFAFEVQTTRHAQTGHYWLIDEVGVEADTMVGAPVKLRLRAATDGSINDGHWQLENVQLVGSVYERNVAILPDRDTHDMDVAPKGTLQMEGIVRNLGREPIISQSNPLYLELRVIPVATEGTEAPPPILRVHGSEGVSSLEGTEIRIQLPNLGGAGHAGDRTRYHFEVQFPDDSGRTYDIVLQVMQEGPEGIFTILDDDNLGDHIREFMVTLRERTLLEAVLTAGPPTVDIDETINLSLEIGNSGTTAPLRTAMWLNATRLWAPADAPNRGEAIDVPILEDLDSAVSNPEGIMRRQIDWKPTDSGFYRVVATFKFDGAAVEEAVTHVLVGATPIYYVENFTSSLSANGWTTTPADCADSMGCWQRSTMFHHDGTHSLFIGSENPMGSYPSGTRATAITPPIDLTWLAPDGRLDRSILTGASLYSPTLSLRYWPLALPAPDSVSVQAARQGEDHARLLTGPWLNGGAEMWRHASFPLTDAESNVVGMGANLLGEGDVSFAFDFNGSTGRGQGFAIDLITVSSYDMDVFPLNHNANLRVGSDKVYHFRVENTGAARDKFTVGIVDNPSSNLLNPAMATVEILNPEVQLEPGEWALVAIRVAIPLQEVGSFAGESLDIMVASTVDPNRLAYATISFDFETLHLPNLVTTLQRPAGQAGLATEGEQVSFAVTVENVGRTASRATEVALFACPTMDQHGNEVDVETCHSNALWTTISEDLPIIGRLPALRQSESWFLTFAWTPPVGSHGDYWIVAVADPDGLVTQFDLASSKTAIPLHVSPIEKPDLHVVDLRVLDARGNSVTRALAGDLLRIVGVVENRGTATAPNVDVRIFNQFPLHEERLGNIPPSGREEVSAQWIAQPGNWVVLLEARTNVIELHNDNNAQRWSLAVRSGVIAAEWESPIMHLQPGESMPTLLRVDNRRDAPEGVKFVPHPGDVHVRDVPGPVLLARGASQEVPIRVAVSPFAEPGRHSLRIDVVQEGTGHVLTSSMLDVYVGAERLVHLAHEPLLMPPGTLARLPLSFENAGTAPESIHIRLQVPGGWKATVMQPSLQLDPGAKRTVETLVEIPSGVHPGRYEVIVEGGTNERIRGIVPVEVTRHAAWSSEVKSRRVSGEITELVVDVNNLGNVLASPPFVMNTAGRISSYAVDPPPKVQEPGETVTYRLTVRGLDGAAARLLLPGHVTEIHLEGRLPRALGDTVHVDVVPLPRIQAGDQAHIRFRVSNLGDAPYHDVVRFWVDGALVAEEQLDLEEGHSKEIAFDWTTSRVKTHLASISVGSGEDAIVRSMVFDVDEANAGVPAPAALGVILAIVAAVILLPNRRGRRLP